MSVKMAGITIMEADYIVEVIKNLREYDVLGEMDSEVDETLQILTNSANNPVEVIIKDK